MTGKNYMRKITETKFYKISLIILILFLMYSSTIFLTNVPKRVVGSPYPTARLWLNTAITINAGYIKPLAFLMQTRIFGLQWIPQVRNYFYDKGIELIPKDDLEREVWWGRVMFWDYTKLYHFYAVTDSLDELLNDYENKEPSGLDFYKKRVNFLMGWTENIYKHYGIAYDKHLKLKDKKLLKTLVSLRTEYMVDYYLLRAKLMYVDKDKAKGEFSSGYFFRSDYEIDRIKKMYDLFDSFNKQVAPTRTQRFQYKNNEEYYQDVELIPLNNFELTEAIVRNMILNNKVNCQDKYLKNYLVSYNELQNLIQNAPMSHRKTAKKYWEIHSTQMKSEQTYKLISGICK